MRPLLLRPLICFVWVFVIAFVWFVNSYHSEPDQIPIHGYYQPAPAPSVIKTEIETETQPQTLAESVAETFTESFAGPVHLIIPVAGVRPEQLVDTYDDARSEDRVHDAIDIMAPAETPVLAAADGKILKLFQSDRGGTTIHQLSVDEKMVFYYAHLARYADSVAEGSVVRQGQIIAYVGDTGNAGAGNFHLHFSVALVSDPKRYWEGLNINPYPLLRR